MRIQFFFEPDYVRTYADNLRCREPFQDEKGQWSIIRGNCTIPLTDDVVQAWQAGLTLMKNVVEIDIVVDM